MTRIPAITSREGLSPEAQSAFDGIASSRGRVSGPFSMLLHSPEIARNAGALGHYLRFESTLPDADRELATLAAGREADCGFEWASHYHLAVEAGVPESTLEVVANRGELDGLDEGHALIIRFVRELVRTNRVSDDTFQAAHARYGDQGVLEFATLIGYYGMLAAVLNTMEVPVPEGAATLPA